MNSDRVGTHDARSQVKSDEDGNIDLEDFRAKAEKHKDNLSAIMVTYPSTYGVFEETITALTQRLFFSVSELELRVDGVEGTQQHRDAVDEAARESTAVS